MKKELNPIEEYAHQIMLEIGHWNYILENGCNDPFWPDGTNMNLTRNHIISYKLEIAKYCEATGSGAATGVLSAYAARGGRKLYGCEKRRKSGSN